MHEPNPNAPPTPANGTVSISGTLLYQNNVGQYGANPGSGSVTIQGAERNWVDTGDCNLVNHIWVCHTVWDLGNVTLTVNGVPGTCSYNHTTNTTSAMMATCLASAITNAASSPVTATASGSTISMTARTSGAVTNYAFSVTSTWYTGCGCFSGPAYSGPSGNLAGGYDAYPGITVYDKGTVTLTTSNGGSATACYGRGGDCPAPPSGCATGDSTTSQLACVLASGLNSGSAVSASASGASISVTDKTPGAVGNSVTVTSSTQSTQTQWTFSPPSYCPMPGCNTTLNNGLTPAT